MKWPGLLFVIFLLYSVPARAQTCQQQTVDYLNANAPIGAVRVIPGGNNYSIAAGTSTALRDALMGWNQACGSRVPELSFTATSSIVFRVNYMTGAYVGSFHRDRCTDAR